MNSKELSPKQIAVNAILAEVNAALTVEMKKNYNVMGFVSKLAWQGKSASEIITAATEFVVTAPAAVYTTTPKKERVKIDPAKIAEKIAKYNGIAKGNFRPHSR